MDYYAKISLFGGETVDLNERNESMRDFFNRKAAESYDEVHAVFMRTKEMITENLPDSTKKVLDLGAGTGLELIYLFKRFPDAAVFVADISEKMLEELDRRDFAPKVTKIVGDFFTVDLGSDYDAVISTSALHHFLKEDKKRLFDRIYACLKPGGIFINSDKFANCPEDEKAWLDDYYENKDKRPHIDTPLAVQTEAELLEKAHFSDIVIIDCDAEYYKLIKATKA